MPSSYKQRSVSRFTNALDRRCTYFFKLLSWPTYRVSWALFFSPKSTVLTDASLPASVMAVGTGFGQLFKSVGQVRAVAQVIEPILNHHSCRLAV